MGLWEFGGACCFEGGGLFFGFEVGGDVDDCEVIRGFESSYCAGFVEY